MEPNTTPMRQDLLAREIARAREAEREQFARELHDGLGENLMAVKMSLQVLGAAHPVSERIAQDAIALVDEMLQTVRSMAWGLRPPVLEAGLVATLRSHIEAESKLTGLAMELDSTLEGTPLRPAVELALFRIVQEAVSNVVRHACATHVWVSLHSRDGIVELSIRDDGQGFEPRQLLRSGESVGIGLSGMRERTMLLGGELYVESFPGAGTTILACVPAG